MAFQNFIPTVWEEEIMHELERNHVFVEDTNRSYEGSVKNRGDSVRLLGIGKPTITRQTGKKIILEAPETVADQSMTLPINQVATFHYEVDDIDKRQAVGGIMEALAKETSEGLADEHDRFIADLAKAKNAVLFNQTVETLTKDNILHFINQMQTGLWDNDVKPNTDIVITIPPVMYMIWKEAYTDIDTNNSEMLKNGRVGRYGGITIKMSNNVAKDASGNYLVQLKTRRAISFVHAIAKTEAYRPERSFSDAIKGFSLFDGAITRPKEMLVAKVNF